MAAGGIKVEGAEQLAKLAADLKIADREMIVVLRRELKAVTLPVIPAIEASIGAVIPRHGGLADTLARDMKVVRSVRVGGRSAGVRIIAAWPGHDIASLNRGRVRHPTFGHRHPSEWVNQTITPGFFDAPIVADEAEMQAGMVAVLDATEARLAGRL